MAQGKRSPGKRPSPRKASPRYSVPVSPSPSQHGHIYVALLIAVTLVAYANAWPNNLVFDDRIFVDPGRYAGMGLADYARFFTENLWAATGSDSRLYRPLLLVWIATQTQVFGDWLAGYHLANIMLHVLATVLVYGFARHLLWAGGDRSAESGTAALLAAVVFGVHPIHTEVVNSVFNGSEILVCIGVAGGLWWFLRARESRAAKAWLGLSLVYFLVLLCRETSAVFPALAVVALWVTSTEPWLMRVRKCLPVLWLLIPLGLYLLLRAQALEVKDIAGEMSVPVPGQSSSVTEPTVEAPPVVEPPATEAPAGAAPTGEVTAGPPAGTEPPAVEPGTAAPPEAPEELLPDVEEQGFTYSSERLLPAVRLWFEYLKIMAWPHPLQIYYDRPSTPAWLAVTVQLLLLGIAVVRYMQKRPGLITGLAFFYIAVLPSSRIIGEGYFPEQADRFLYLPSVGLAIALAFGLKLLAERFSLRAAVVVVAAVTLVLTPLSWARNADWASDIALLESDYPKLRFKGPLLSSLLAAHIRDKNYARAVEICDLEAHYQDQFTSTLIHCGGAYAYLGRFSAAEAAYVRATSGNREEAWAHVNLAMIYVHLGRRSEALERFQLAVAAEKQDFLKEYFTALMLLQIYPADRDRLLEAKAHLERALQLQPQHVDSRKELDALNQRLARRPKQ